MNKQILMTGIVRRMSKYNYVLIIIGCSEDVITKRMMAMIPAILLLSMPFIRYAKASDARQKEAQAETQITISP